MRPALPSPIVERIEAIYEQAGYGSEGELVRDAVRRWVNELEEEFGRESRPEDADFEFEVYSRRSGFYLVISAREESDVQIDGHTIETDTARTSVPTSELKNIQYVEDTYVTEDSLAGIDRELSNDEFVVLVEHVDNTEVTEVVDEIFTTLWEQVGREEDLITQAERAASKYAVPKDEG